MEENPYAAPRSEVPAAHAARGTSIKWIYAANVAALAIAAGTPAYLHRPLLRDIGAAIALLSGPLVIGLVWLAVAWSSIPLQHRPKTGFRPIMAVEAVLRLFIPVYGVYWTFAIHWYLCRGISSASGHASHWWPIAMVAIVFLPTGLAGISRFYQLGWLILVSYSTWFLYMLACDSARARIARPRSGSPR